MTSSADDVYVGYTRIRIYQTEIPKIHAATASRIKSMDKICTATCARADAPNSSEALYGISASTSPAMPVEDDSMCWDDDADRFAAPYSWIRCDQPLSAVEDDNGALYTFTEVGDDASPCAPCATSACASASAGAPKPLLCDDYGYYVESDDDLASRGMIRCGDCGNVWDGNAQCNCWQYGATFITH